MTGQAPGRHGPAKAPWHFKLLVAAAAVYVGFRLVQIVAWIVQRLG